MKTFAIVAAAAAALTMTAQADITMNIWDDGTDLYMSATGDYDMTSAVVNPSTFGLGRNATAWGDLGFFGWESGAGTTTYNADYTGTFSGGDSSSATSVMTTNPFWFNTSGTIVFSNNNLTGSVDELAIFEGKTFASLGLVVGQTINVSWGGQGLNERATINTVAVPAPGALALLGLGGLAGTRRRRA